LPDTPSRHLAPPKTPSDTGNPQTPRVSGSALRNVSFGIPTQSIYTIVTALAIVIGAFLVFSWALRRGSKKSGRRIALPAEVVSVLGRAPLAARQFAELLRVGNKLVLVAQTASGPTTITEVTDPAEVDRLVGLCQQYDPHSTTKAFEQVFQQLTSESTAGGFLGNEGLPPSLSSAASAYRSHRGSSRV
jgi:flagellar biogenesis protein FliO